MQNPFEAIGLPPTFVPTPGAWRWGKAQAVTPEGPVVQHVLILDLASGRCALVLTPDELRRMLDQGEQQLSGIEIARGLPEGNGR